MGLQVYLKMIVLIVLAKVGTCPLVLKNKEIKNAYFYEIMTGILRSVRGKGDRAAAPLIVLLREDGCSVTRCLSSCFLDSSAMMDSTLELKGRINPFIHTLFLSEYFITETGK